MNMFKIIIFVLFLFCGCSSRKSFEVEGVEGVFKVPKDRIIGRIPWDPSPRGGGFVFSGCWGDSSEETCIGPEYILVGRVGLMDEQPPKLREIRGSIKYDTIKDSVVDLNDGDEVRVYLNENIFKRYVIVRKTGGPGWIDGIIETECSLVSPTHTDCIRGIQGDGYSVEYVYVDNGNIDFEMMDRDVIEMVESWHHEK